MAVICREAKLVRVSNEIMNKITRRNDPLFKMGVYVYFVIFMIYNNENQVDVTTNNKIRFR